MLERVDAHEGDVSKVTSGDYRRIVDLCWQCKLCFNHCPYTPPHRFDIDFPRLLLRAKAARARKEGISIQDRVLGNADAVGRLGGLSAPLSNWGNAFPPARFVLEKVAGIERSRRLPRFHRETFVRWFRRRRKATPSASPDAAAPPPRVALFATCLVNYNVPQLGRDTVAVLEKNGCQVACPEGQVCCGMPYLDGGDLEGGQANARKNLDVLLPLVEQGMDVVVPEPTCSYMLKKEYPRLVPGEAAEKVAAKTFDFFEYLVNRHKQGGLVTDFPGPGPGKVAYQMPCHLRAQNMGYKTRDVLQLIPGTRVTVVERCTAMDGTWGMKKEFFPISLQFARKAAQEMEAAGPDTYATDCTLAGLQIAEVRGQEPAHPISLLRRAYGLPEEH